MATGVEWSNSMSGNNYDSAIDKAVEASLQQAGIMLERKAVALTPVDSGRLRGSITYQTRETGSRVDAPATNEDEIRRPLRKWLLHVGSNVDYAQHIEYGTVKMGAQPFLRPALNLFKNEILRDFGKWVEHFLRKGK